MTEDITRLKEALDIVINSEEVGDECENANYHSLQDFLQEIRDQLHEHNYTGEKYTYGDGSYEVECVVNGCYKSIFVEPAR
jgi:hypothetical protein